VNVYVSAVDLQVAAPSAVTNLANSYSATVQAGDDDMTMDGNEPGCGPATAARHMGDDKDDPNAMAVYFGERIVSFRQLLKRYNLHSSFIIANTSATIPALWVPTFTDTPFYYGYNSAALHTTTALGKFSYCANTLQHWLMPAFVAMRGAQRSKYVVNTSNPGAAGSLTVTRTNGGGFLIPSLVTNVAISSQSNYARLANSTRRDLLEGAATTIVASQPCLEVEFPYYKPVRFDECRSIIQTSTGVGFSSPFYNTHAVELTLAPGTTPVTLSRYTGVGEDFSLFWFQGCPPMQVLNPPA